MRNFSLVMLLCLSVVSCGQESRNVGFFKGTKAYELAKSVEREDLNKIEKLVKENSELLNITNKTSGSNVLSLSLTLENFEAFKKLLELGANANFVNPYSKRSILIDACKFYDKPEPYTIDLRYIELLLQYGANPNYTVEEDFTDEKGRSYMATSPLMEASTLDLGMVKLLIKAGADPYKKLKQNQETPFSITLRGFKNKIEIATFFIDSIRVDVKQPMRVRKNDSLYIQDYIEKYMGYKEGTESDKNKQKFIQKLESMGVDFKNYSYKK